MFCTVLTITLKYSYLKTKQTRQELLILLETLLMHFKYSLSGWLKTTSQKHTHSNMFSSDITIISAVNSFTFDSMNSWSNCAPHFLLSPNTYFHLCCPSALAQALLHGQLCQGTGGGAKPN